MDFEVLSTFMLLVVTPGAAFRSSTILSRGIASENSTVLRLSGSTHAYRCATAPMELRQSWRIHRTRASWTSPLSKDSAGSQSQNRKFLTNVNMEPSKRLLSFRLASRHFCGISEFDSHRYSSVALARASVLNTRTSRVGDPLHSQPTLGRLSTRCSPTSARISRTTPSVGLCRMKMRLRMTR